MGDRENSRKELKKARELGQCDEESSR
jgi:hypothetical protein